MQNRYPAFLLLVLLLLAGCQSVYRLQVKDDLDTSFRESVRDAATAQPSEISAKLLRLTPENRAVRTDGKGRFLMLTWTNWDGYEQSLGKDMELSREIWVTAAPQVQQFCKNVRPQYLDLRLEQLLGLPPDNGKTHFVEMWVNPEDIFRPCPDPEISDQVCELNFPTSSFLTIAEAHKKWIRDLQGNSYGDDGYPWTQLGYTYDWGNPDSDIGVSEFVVRQGATVYIHAVKKTADYCQKKQ